jgi:hypothetical protein
MRMEIRVLRIEPGCLFQKLSVGFKFVDGQVDHAGVILQKTIVHAEGQGGLGSISAEIELTALGSL